MKLTAIIVDDEPLGRERIRMLASCISDLEIIAECENGHDAVSEVDALTPDLLFLDIQMPGLDGFGVVENLKSKDIPLPGIIFVTAYDAHAVQAFEINALDYLLKPVQQDRLKSAVDRVRSQQQSSKKRDVDARLEKLLLHLQPDSRPVSYIRRVEVRSQGRIDYISVEDIEWIETDGNYVSVHTADQQHLARITMSELENSLDPQQFFRVSRKFMVRLNQVVTLKSEGRRDHRIILKSGVKLPFTRPLLELQERLRAAD